MNEAREKVLIKWAAAASFFGALAVNVLANVLPINGVSTGEVSDSFQNLFAPAGITFSIWGMIYLLLIIYAVYQTGLFQSKSKVPSSELTGDIAFPFIASSVANAAWIFAWHYGNIFLSMMLMVVLLVSLILIVRRIKKEHLSRAQKYLIRLPFSVYFGWITVAVIANAAVFLVYLNFDGFRIPPEIWTVAILLIGTIIGCITTIMHRDIAYGLVIVWAYVGIWLEHHANGRHAGQYPEILITVVICIICLIGALLYVALKGRSNTDVSPRD